MHTKVGKVHEGGSNLGEVASGYRAVNAQTIRFEKDAFFLQPCEEVAVRASKLDVAEAAVAQDVAADAYLCLVLFFEANGCHLKVLFEFSLSSRE